MLSRILLTQHQGKSQYVAYQYNTRTTTSAKTMLDPQKSKCTHLSEYCLWIIRAAGDSGAAWEACPALPEIFAEFFRIANTIQYVLT